LLTLTIVFQSPTEFLHNILLFMLSAILSSQPTDAHVALTRQGRSSLRNYVTPS